MAKKDHYTEELFMQRALELAELGRGSVSPNPLVGCVIVHDGRIIGEGWHQKYGEAHAEVNAVNSIVDRSLLANSTVYVTLEPCSHFGKTPPCADMLIRENVKKVVIGNVDINPLVSGEGVKKLRASGIEVLTGILEAQASELNKRFFTFIKKKRPYIILKWAETSDGFTARENYDSRWISNELSRQLVHKWRSEEDAILVGTKTAEHDDPQLNVRDWSGRDPLRLVIDKFLKLPHSLKLFNGNQRTMCFNVVKNEQRNNISFVRLDEDKFLNQLIEYIYAEKIQSVIVEGGAQTLQSFIDAELWDEARVFVNSKCFENGIAAPKLHGEIKSTHEIQSDTLKFIFPKK
jgi:diaminohydroxyphosphoribosylaminopyrimidine deaminase / 5-amino-6-(5-phosphoribosylamino)uracil reductase